MARTVVGFGLSSSSASISGAAAMTAASAADGVAAVRATVCPALDRNLVNSPIPPVVHFHGPGLCALTSAP
jgi:hypothetical protein